MPFSLFFVISPLITHAIISPPLIITAAFHTLLRHFYHAIDCQLYYFRADYCFFFLHAHLMLLRRADYAVLLMLMPPLRSYFDAILLLLYA